MEIKASTLTITFPDGTVKSYADAWHHTIFYKDPFQRAVGHYFTLKAIACTLRHVAS